MIVILDSGVLYSLISQSSVQVVIDCKKWFEQLLVRSVLVVSSEICDYEVRRELIRRNNQEVIENLEQLRKGIDFLPINHETLVLASNFWAIARN